MSHDFSLRYLTAKKTVDDRALNAHVWQQMAAVLTQGKQHVLEIGTGIGAMVERLDEHGLLNDNSLTAIDSDPNHINIATEWLRARSPNAEIGFEAIDLLDFAEREQGQRSFDMVMAHAFLDLMDIPYALPRIFSLLKPGGSFYFTLNFDGATIFEPSTDAWFDALVENVYHRTMDERRVNGRFSSGSKSGRRLFTFIPEAGGQILASGSSDWVVFPGPDGYAADEAFFLECIVRFVETSLNGRPEIDPSPLEEWVDEKLVFIQRRELTFIAHQLDFFGTVG